MRPRHKRASRECKPKRMRFRRSYLPSRSRWTTRNKDDHYIYASTRPRVSGMYDAKGPNYAFPLECKRADSELNSLPHFQVNTDLARTFITFNQGRFILFRCDADLSERGRISQRKANQNGSRPYLRRLPTPSVSVETRNQRVRQMKPN